MASLNTLRTKFGFTLSVIIALALLAFIFSLKSEMGFSGSDPVVGEINSDEVLYSEYYAEYQEVKTRSGATESTEQEAANIAATAWQSLISKKLLMPDFKLLGIDVSEAERLAVVNGSVPSQVFNSAFADPATGVYNPVAVADYLSQAASNPQVEEVWTGINAQAKQERSFMKYNALVKLGTYVNKMQVAEGVAAANNSYEGKWVSVPYSSIPDSLITITDADIKKYYDEHQAMFKKTPTRSISYVSFGFDATEQDIVNIENTALQVSKEFAATEDIPSFVRGNYYAQIASNYVPASQLEAAQASALGANQMYGPVNNNNVWTMSRVASSLMAPDSLALRHIVLRYDQAALADSLLVALRSGANFAEAAAQHSLYAQTAQAGGEVGVMPFSAFSDEFVTALAPAKKGQIVKVESGDMIQLLEVYRADKPSRHYKVATVEYPVEASQATIAALHSDAGLFSVAAKGSIEKFNSSAEASAEVVKTASLTQGERTVRGINDSREIARWAFGAKAGELSEIFKTDEGYIVAMLSEIDDEPYRSLASVKSIITTTLTREKKFALAAAKLVGNTIDEVAAATGSEVKEFSNVRSTSQYVAGIGVEPRLVGAIALGNIEGLSAPVQGNTAAYVVEVSPVVVAEGQTAELERVRAQSTAENRATQYVYDAIHQMANVKDLRGQYF